MKRPRTAEFARKLKQLREAKGMSLTSLADRLHVSTPCVWNWENGKSLPRPRVRAELAKILNTSVEELRLPSAKIERSQSAAAVNDLVMKAKLEIAAACGLPPSRVEITVRY